MRRFAAAATVVGALALTLPAASPAATCSDHPDQASAQRAKDTRDADGDGIYCEANPCPCARPGQDRSTPAPAKPRRKVGCSRPPGVQNVSFSATTYRHVRAHFLHALRVGWPRTLVVNRPGADARRDRLLESFSTKAGFDRDEYPPAMGRGRGPGLEQGSDPRGWQASVRLVPSSENRSHGARLGAKTRRFCNGTRFRYVFF